MSKKLISLIFIIFVSCLLTGCTFNIDRTRGKDTGDSVNIGEVAKSMKLIIDEKEYDVVLENNETVNAFVQLLPIELSMNELNGNEKYSYLDVNLPTKAYYPKHINKGDVMLFGDNCLVIFYKSFDTSYSYTNIGYINNLPDLGNSDVRIRFER